jgi:HAMP domain-containing protein
MTASRSPARTAKPGRPPEDVIERCQDALELPSGSRAQHREVAVRRDDLEALLRPWESLLAPSVGRPGSIAHMLAFERVLRITLETRGIDGVRRLVTTRRLGSGVAKRAAAELGCATKTVSRMVQQLAEHLAELETRAAKHRQRLRGMSTKKDGPAFTKAVYAMIELDSQLHRLRGLNDAIDPKVLGPSQD